MPTKRFPVLPDPPNQAPMWQDEENDPYQGVVSHRGYDAHVMREFPAPFATDPGLTGEGDDLPGLQEPGEMLGMPLIDEASMQQRDPRIDAIEQMARQGQVQRPGMKNADDLQRFETQQGLPSTRDRLANPRKNLMEGLDDGRGSPNDQQEAAGAADLSDEELLDQVHKQMAPQDSNSLSPFTGDYDKDIVIMNKAWRTPGVDANALEEMFNELHGEDDAQQDDRRPTLSPNDPPTNEDDMRKGRY